MGKPQSSDIAIITVLPEEYEAVVTKLHQHGCQLDLDPASLSQPNQYGWVTGKISDVQRQEYRIVVAIAVSPGQSTMSNVVRATVSRFKPRYVLLVGIAGGLPQDNLNKGDVTISRVIYDYEYGKLTSDFLPRHDFTYQISEALLTSSIALHVRDSAWVTIDRELRPKELDCNPKLVTGAIASGNKVVDCLDNSFFEKVLEAWPKLLAVEMEGAGAVATIRSINEGNLSVGFIMIRGISDMPKRVLDPGAAGPTSNTLERDTWKKYAAAVAATFTVHWITRAWPIPPRKPRSKSVESKDQPDDDLPPSVSTSSGARSTDSDIEREIPATSESSIWLGYSPALSQPSQLNADAGSPSETTGSLLLKDIEHRFSKSSLDLLRWPTTVSGDKWLERPELNGLKETVSNEPHSVTMVLGPPGSGKSALLSRLGQELVKEGFAVLAIKADQLDKAIDTSAKLTEWLRLSLPVDSAILSVAKSRPIVVLFDQLDALADLADLHSQRLHVLLNLIYAVAGNRHVHVICSCRNLEYHHDGRLNRLEAKVMRLEAPAWEQVSALLSQRGIQPDFWPGDAKELLRIPYHLSLFLKRFKEPGEHLVFTTYQELINELWQKNVVDVGGGRSELLFDLANKIASGEELWIDRTFYEDRWATVNTLIAADILRLSENGLQLSFRHQSLFEFVRAKAFSRENGSLASYVLERQDAIFVRPTLWMTLNYLRNASPGVYRREFERLLKEASARHIKHLLIDFLSQIEVPMPADWEQGKLISALNDESWRLKVLSAICNRRVWFELLEPSHLPAEMQKPAEKAWDVIWVLISALDYASEKCIVLMEQNWLPDDSKLQLIWRTLDYLRDWNDRSFELSLAVVRRTGVEQGAMRNRTETMNKPGFAVRLLATWLESALHRILSSEVDERKKGSRIVDILDRHNQWHGIDDLVKSDPAQFARRVWPVLCRMIMSLGHNSSDYVIRYPDDHIAFSRLDRREYVVMDSPDQFFLAIDKAIREFAKTEPEDFITVIRNTCNPDSRLLQRLMCRGMCEIAASHPEFAMEFLLLDSRRFWLGGMHDDMGDSIGLISVLAPELAQEKLTELTNAIQQWEMYREDGDTRNEYARAHRYRLLEALPIGRLPDGVREVIASERESLPSYLQVPHSQCGTGLQSISSPVSQAEMSAMADAEIAKKFVELPDSTFTHHPKDWMTGGSIQLSQEFERFAKDNPERAIEVSTQFQPGKQERPSASLIRALLSIKRPLEEIIELIEQFDQRGFSGREFRESVAFDLGDSAVSEGLPDRACQILQKWRCGDWPEVDFNGEDKTRSEYKSQPTSILWQNGGWHSRPNGRFAILEALTMGYLCRKPPSVDEWVDTLIDHLDRNECLAVWSGMCRYLENVRACSDKDKARRLLDTLFARFPGILSGRLGIFFLANVDHLLTDESRKKACEIVRGCDEQWGLQVFGELVCLRYLRHSDDVWAKEQVEAAIRNATSPELEWIATGIAFTAAKLWREPLVRDRVSVILEQLIPIEINPISHAAMSIWNCPDVVPSDNNTLNLLRQIAENPAVLKRAIIDETFFDHLLDHFNSALDLVCRISEDAVRLRGDELQRPTFSFHMASSALIDISMRLQRCGGEYRKRGMELLERLLDLGVSEAINIARSNDHRLAPGAGPIRPLRRKRI